MSGTKAGGIAAAETNKKKYGADFYSKIGSRGGKKGRTGGFAAGQAGRERARKYGAMGGRLSRRGKANAEPEIAKPVGLQPQYMYKVQ